MRPDRSGRGPRPRALLIALALAAPLPGAAGARAAPPPGAADGQAGSALPAAASEALAVGRAAADRGRADPARDTIDADGWREALRAGERALEAAPGALEPLLFMARTYSDVGWHSRAWRTWNEWLAAGGLEEPGAEPEPLPTEPGPGERSDAERYAGAGTGMAWSREVAGDLPGALAYLDAVLTRVPGDLEALRTAARLRLELGDAEAALALWERVAERLPDDPDVAYALTLAREAVEVGPEASRAWREGIRLYEAGDLEAALERFEVAAAAAPEWAEAAEWRARTLLETGRSAEAVPAWEAVLALRPDDGAAAWFLGVARVHAERGRAAGTAWFEGQAAYEAGDVAGAAAAFARAAAASPEWSDAWIWAARTAQESGDARAAVAAWERALELEPGDDGIAWFLEVARRQLAYGAEAGAAYAEGARRFELGDLSASEEALERAVAARPDLVDAWALLGRTRFARADWAGAADAYARALELRPDDEDVAFFLEEARRRAGLPPADGGGGASGREGAAEADAAGGRAAGEGAAEEPDAATTVEPGDGAGDGAGGGGADPDGTPVEPPPPEGGA